MKNYPLIKVAVFFIIGIVLQKIFSPEASFIFISTGIVIFLSTILLLINLKFDTQLLFFIFAAAGIMLTSALMYSIAEKSLKSYPFKETKITDVILYGEISNIELDREYEIRMNVGVDSLRAAGKNIVHLNHSFICRIRDSKSKMKSIYNSVRIGSYISVKGVLTKARERRNPGEFDFNKYLEQKNISGIITTYEANDFRILDNKTNYFNNSIFIFRKLLDEQISNLLNKESASLVKGLLLADRSEINPEIKNDFINTGVIHVLAVSGLHVGYILLIFIFIFGRFNIVLRILLTCTGLIFFTLITGAPPSVVRASIMAILIFTAFLSNRSTNIYNSLAFAALIILVINPLDLFNPGFQLSFSAVASIAFFYPIFNKRIIAFGIKSKVVSGILLFTAVSLSAQIGTLPFTLIYFQKLSVVSLAANLLVIPSIGVILGSSIFMLFLNIFWNWGSLIYASTINLFTTLLFSFIHSLSSLSFSYLNIRQFTTFDMLLFYIFTAIFFSSLTKFTSRKAKLLLLISILANVLLYCSLDNKKILPENQLSIIAIDVGQGDSFLIKFPNNKTALIDAGEANFYFDNGERIILPLLNLLDIDTIDYAFISHVDSDHYSGFISIINSGKVKQVIKPALDTAYKKDIRLEKFLKEKDIPVKYYSKSIIKEGDVRIYILNVPGEQTSLSMNDRSGIIKIVYGDNSFLFVGDAGVKAEKYLVKKYNSFLKADFLKLGHHGSGTSTSDEFLNAVQPETGLISAGLYNKFRHPSAKVLNKLQEKDVLVYRTDLSGAVILNCDGKNISVIDWKNI